MDGMSKLAWPDERSVSEIEAVLDDVVCVGCGQRGTADDVRYRKLRSLKGPVKLRVPVRKCTEATCPLLGERVGSEIEFAFAPPNWTVTWDLFAWMGHRRFGRHWSVPQIRSELSDRFALVVSADWVEDSLRRYQVIVAGRQDDLERLREEYADVGDLVFTIDGLQPEKGHETLYVVREMRLGRVWFAEPLLSSSEAEVHRLFERAKRMAEAVGKPVRCWMSDKQQAFVTGVEKVFAGVPHRYCNNHFLRDLAKPVLEKDSHAKVQMRRKVRGLRTIEKRMLLDLRSEECEERVVESAPVGNSTSLTGVSSAAPTSETTPQTSPDPSAVQREVVLDYCSAVRGILNDDQGGPLSPPGVRMEVALAEVQASIESLLAPKKGEAVEPVEPAIGQTSSTNR